MGLEEPTNRTIFHKIATTMMKLLWIWTNWEVTNNLRLSLLHLTWRIFWAILIKVRTFRLLVLETSCNSKLSNWKTSSKRAKTSSNFQERASSTKLVIWRSHISVIQPKLDLFFKWKRIHLLKLMISKKNQSIGMPRAWNSLAHFYQESALC